MDRRRTSAAPPAEQHACPPQCRANRGQTTTLACDRVRYTRPRASRADGIVEARASAVSRRLNPERLGHAPSAQGRWGVLWPARVTIEGASNGRGHAGMPNVPSKFRSIDAGTAVAPGASRRAPVEFSPRSSARPGSPRRRTLDRTKLRMAAPILHQRKDRNMTRPLVFQVLIAALMSTGCGGASTARSPDDADPREAREGAAREPVERSEKSEKAERPDKPQKEERSGGGHEGHH